MGSPCIGNIGRYEKVTADISMRGEFHPAISPGGLIAGWYRGQHHPPEYGEASVVHLRDPFSIHPEMWIPEAIIAFVIAPSQTSSETNTLHGKLYLVVCASGDSEAGVRGSTGWNLDRSCSPPHF